MNELAQENHEALALKVPLLRPDRFQSAAAHYEKGRIPYAQALIRRIAQCVGLEPEHRVLDLGCGPGMLARGFASFGCEVVAMDPSTEMLNVARKLAGEAPGISFVKGSSYDLGPALGSFQLVVMGRSFHWMDRVDTLNRLDGMIAPTGAIALFHDSSLAIPVNAWRKRWQEIRERYEPNTESHASDPNWIRHEAILLNSPFARLERFGVIERRAIDVETLVERTLSMSSTSPSHLGDRTAAMIEEVRTLLSEVREEVAETEALVAWRSDAG